MKGLLSLCLLVLIISIGAFAQDGTIAGTVMDVEGQLLLTARIFVKGSDAPFLANMKGDDTITVHSNNDTLVFQYVGYVPQQIASTGKSVANASLKEKRAFKGVLTNAKSSYGIVISALLAL